MTGGRTDIPDSLRLASESDQVVVALMADLHQGISADYPRTPPRHLEHHHIFRSNPATDQERTKSLLHPQVERRRWSIADPVAVIHAGEEALPPPGGTALPLSQAMQPPSRLVDARRTVTSGDNKRFSRSAGRSPKTVKTLKSRTAIQPIR
jgi:hypothetical protein